MAERYEPVKALESFLAEMEGNSSPSIPVEIVIDLIKEAIRHLEKILAMGPRSLEFAAPAERDEMLQAIEAVREQKVELVELLERAFQLERDGSPGTETSQEV
jgi:hypothetical protein